MALPQLVVIGLMIAWDHPLIALVGGLTALVVGVLTLQPPTVHTVQRGYRGTGQQLEYSPALVAAAFAANQAPSVLPQNNAGPAPSPGSWSR